jgi:hypothetical protein
MTGHLGTADAEAQALMSEQQAAPLPANIVGGDPEMIGAEVAADQQELVDAMLPDAATEFQTPPAAQALLAAGPAEIQGLAHAQDPGLTRFQNLEQALELPDTEFDPDRATFDQVIDPNARSVPAEVTSLEVDMSAPADMTFPRSSEDPIAGTAAMNEIQAQVSEQFEAQADDNITNVWEQDLAQRGQSTYEQRVSELEGHYEGVRGEGQAEMERFRTDRPAVEPGAQMMEAQRAHDQARGEADGHVAGLQVGYSESEAQFHTELATEDAAYQGQLTDHGAAYTSEVEGHHGGYSAQYADARGEFETEHGGALGELHGGQQGARMTAEAQFSGETSAYDAGVGARRGEFDQQQAELDAGFETHRNAATTQLDSEMGRVRGEANSEIQSRSTGTRRQVQQMQQQGQAEVDRSLASGRQEYQREIDRGVEQAERERRSAQRDADTKRNEDKGILERIGDAIASVVDWIADCFATARDAICNFLERAKQAALSKLRQWRQRALTALRRVRDGIQGAISGAANWIRAKVRAAGQAIRGVIQRASTMMQGVVQRFTDGINVVVEGFRTGVNALADGFTSAVGMINEDLGNRLTEVKDEYMGRFNAAVDNAQASVSAAGEELQTNIQSGADNLSAQVQQAEDDMIQRVDTLEENLHQRTEALYVAATVAVNETFDRAEEITTAAFDAAQDSTREWFDRRIAGLRSAAQGIRDTASWLQGQLDSALEWLGEIADACLDVLGDAWTAVRSGFVAFWNSPWRDVVFAVALTVLAVVVTVATAGAGAPLLVAALAAAAAAGTAAAATYGAGEFAARRANVSLIQEGEQTWRGRTVPVLGPDGRPLTNDEGEPLTQPDPTDPANDWYVDTLGSIRRDNDGMLTYVDENGQTQRVDPSQPGARELLLREGMRRDEQGNLLGETLGESGTGAGTLAAQKGVEHAISGFAVGLTAGTGGGILANMGTTGRIFTQGAISYGSSTAVDPLSNVIEQQVNTDRGVGDSLDEWWQTRSHERDVQYERDADGNEIADENGNPIPVGYGRGRELSGGEIATQEAVAFAGNVATAGLAHGGNVWLQNRGIPMNIMDRSLRQSVTARGVDLATGVAGEALSLGGNVATGREQGVNSWEDFQERLVIAAASSTASGIATDHAVMRGANIAVRRNLGSDPAALDTFKGLSRRDQSHVAEILQGGSGPLRPEGGGGSTDMRTQRIRGLLSDPEVLAAFNSMPEPRRLAYSRSLEAAEVDPAFKQALRGRSPEDQAALGELVGQNGDTSALRGVLADGDSLEMYMSLSPGLREQYARRLAAADEPDARNELNRQFADEDLIGRFSDNPDSVPPDQQARAQRLLKRRQELEEQTRAGGRGTSEGEGETGHRVAENSDDVRRGAEAAGDGDEGGGTSGTRRPSGTGDETQAGGTARRRPTVRHDDAEFELSKQGVWTRDGGVDTDGKAVRVPIQGDDVSAVLARYTRVGDGRWRRPNGTFASKHEIIQLNRRRGTSAGNEAHNETVRRAAGRGSEVDGERRASTELADDIVSQYGRNMGESPLRQNYLAEVRRLETELTQMVRDAGGTITRDVAQRMHQRRRAIGQRYKDATPEALRHYIYEVNQGRYGDPLGPGFAFLERKYSGNYELIARRAASPNDNVDGLLQQFGGWLRQQPQEYLESQQQGMNPRRVPSHGPDEEPNIRVNADQAETRTGSRSSPTEDAAQSEPMPGVRRYQDLLQRQQQGDTVDLSTVPRPGLGDVNEDGKVVIGQGAGRWEDSAGNGRIEVLIPADQPLPPGATLIEANVSPEIARAANLLSSSGADPPNATRVEIITRGRTFKRISVPHDQTIAPTSRVAADIDSRTHTLRGALGADEVQRIIASPEYTRLSPNDRLTHLDEVISARTRSPAEAQETTPGTRTNVDADEANAHAARLNESSASYEERGKAVLESNGRMTSEDAFTDASGDWLPSRKALHDRLVARAVEDAQAFAQAMKDGDPALYAMRGNTAAGKTRTVKSGHIPELEGAVRSTDNLRHRAINPDNFKLDLMEADAAAFGGQPTHSQVHAESSHLAQRLQQELFALRGDDGSPSSVLVDQRLGRTSDVDRLANVARGTGRKLNVYDVDAELEASLTGVLGRKQGGADPIPPFSVVAEGGFGPARRNRLEVIQRFIEDPELGKYQLFATRANGDKVAVARVEGGELTVLDDALFTRLTTDPRVEISRLADTVIDDTVIRRITDPMPDGDWKQSVIDDLTANKGRTWRDAINRHGGNDTEEVTAPPTRTSTPDDDAATPRPATDSIDARDGDQAHPGATGGRVKREDFFDGRAPDAAETAAVRTASEASDDMTLGAQMAALETQPRRSARDVLVAAEEGLTPRFVARVGNREDSFAGRGRTDVYAADIADMRGLVGKPEEAMRMVGWTSEWIAGQKESGSTIYVVVVDTHRVPGWKTSQIDWAGIRRTATADIADPDSRLSTFASKFDIEPSAIPSLFDDLQQIAPGAPRPEHLQDFQEVLSKSYGLNELYSGGGFTVTDETVGGRVGNVGAQEVKVSGDDLSLDPAGRGVWWEAIPLGTLSKD